MTSCSSTNGELRSALGRYTSSLERSTRLRPTLLSWVVVDASVPELTKAINAAFVGSARRDWDVAGEVLRGLVEEDDGLCRTQSIFRSFMRGLARAADIGVVC